MSKQSKKTITFGLHLMVDAYDCDQKVLANANLLYKLLDSLPTELGMRKMIKPYIVSTEGNNIKDPGGWSGFILIEESHISLHTFVKRGFVTIDVYSCKEFDIKIALKYLKKVFKTSNLEYIVEKRGKKYPAENIEK